MRIQQYGKEEKNRWRCKERCRLHSCFDSPSSNDSFISLHANDFGWFFRMSLPWACVCVPVCTHANLERTLRTYIGIHETVCTTCASVCIFECVGGSNVGVWFLFSFCYLFGTFLFVVGQRWWLSAEAHIYTWATIYDSRPHGWSCCWGGLFQMSNGVCAPIHDVTLFYKDDGGVLVSGPKIQPKLFTTSKLMQTHTTCLCMIGLSFTSIKRALIHSRVWLVSLEQRATMR